MSTRKRNDRGRGYRRGHKRPQTTGAAESFCPRSQQQQAEDKSLEVLPCLEIEPIETFSVSSRDRDTLAAESSQCDAVPEVSEANPMLTVGGLDENKKKDLTCTVCLEVFTDPKVLPCCHTFCLECLKGICAKSVVQDTISCPQCRMEHKVPAGGPSVFLSDLSLAHDIASMNLYSTKRTSICELCDQGDAAISFCSDCHHYLCEFCTQAHKRMKRFKNHSLCSADSLGEKGSMPVLKMSTNSFLCSVHPSEELKVFCKKCRLLVCCKCIVNEHNGHDLGDVDANTQKEFEDEVNGLMPVAEDKIAEFERNLEYVKEVEKMVQSRPEPLKLQITQVFDPLIALLESRRAEVLKKVDQSTEECLKELWAQKDFLENTLTGLRSSYSYAKRLQKSGKESEMAMMYFHNLTLTLFKQMKERSWDGISTRKIESTSLCFSPNNLPNLSYLKVENLLVNKNETDSSGLDFKIDMKTVTVGRKVTVCLQCDSLSPRNKLKFDESTNYSVSICHGQSQQYYGVSFDSRYGNPPRISYPKIQKNSADCSVSITFIPVVSGSHEIQVKYNVSSSGNYQMFEKSLQLNATGLPHGNVVQGPDWIKDDNAKHNYQLKTGKVTLISHANNSRVAEVQVIWQYIYYNSTYYRNIDGTISLKHTLSGWEEGNHCCCPIMLSIDESNYTNFE